MNKQNSIADIKAIISRSFSLLGRHWIIYLIPLVYAVIASVVLSVIGCFLTLFVYIFTIVALIETGGWRDFITVLFSGSVGFVFLGVILTLIFVSGYIGGLGFMLKELLKTGKVRIGDFRIGVYRHGHRLFFGTLVMLILLALPFYWGTIRLLHMYGIYDIATMQSGWNFSLRETLSALHSNVVLLTYSIDFIIILLFGFWWIISITESRHFITAFIKSVIFFFRNPSGALLLIIGNLVCLYVAALFFGALWSLLGWASGLGLLLGLFLFLPVTILTMMQFYNPSFYRQEPEPIMAPPVMINLTEVKE